jgi:hypothetical protein
MRARRRPSDRSLAQGRRDRPRDPAVTRGHRGKGEIDCAAGGAPATTVTIAILPGSNLQERTLEFRIPAGIDPAELRQANFALAGGLATFTVAWVHEGDPDDGYFDAPFGESGQTLIGAVNIARRRLQVYLRARGMTPCFTDDHLTARAP